MKNRSILPIVAVLCLLFASCSKDKRIKRDIEGTWTVREILTRSYFSGTCDIPASQFGQVLIPYPGTVEFNTGKANFDSSARGAQPGKWNVDYAFTNTLGSHFQGTLNHAFDWSIQDEELIMENQDLNLYQVYSLSDSEAIGLLIETEAADESGCEEHTIRYTITEP